jgi:YHS domain-containing protein
MEYSGMNSEEADSCRCTLCRMHILESPVKKKIRGKEYYFCSDECRSYFERTLALAYLYCMLVSLSLLAIGLPMMYLLFHQVTIVDLLWYIFILHPLYLGILLLVVLIRQFTKDAEIRRRG